MKYISFIVPLTLIVAACGDQGSDEPVMRTRIDGKATASPSPTPSETDSVTSQVESACRSIIFENVPLTHCLAVPSRHRISMDLGPSGGAPYRSLSAFSKANEDAPIVFAMNAGMFDDEGKPIGYFVEDSQRLQTLNTAEGKGNFYLKPNGVFYGSGDSWTIRTTDDFLANVKDRPQFGTQSGPMLVINGKIHPEITENGPSRMVRNAVGVDDKGRAHFVISNAPLSFGVMARFYKNELSVKNALYLDGEVSALWNPATDRLDNGAAIGPIVVVERKE